MSRSKRDVLERAMEKVDVTDTCWLWTAHINRAGYGRIGTQLGTDLAHRVIYQLTVGPIPDGLHLDHLCRVRHCVNPAHLEPVTAAENLARSLAPLATKMRHAARTHCKNGHEFSEENTGIDGNGSRVCRTCARMRSLAYFKRKAAAA